MSEWTENVVPEVHCPYCDKQLDRAGDPEGGRDPQEGDFSVCIGCAQVLVFKADLSVRKPTSDELAEAETDPVMRKMQRVIRELDRRKP